MVNRNKVQQKRFWDLWKISGALSSIRLLRTPLDITNKLYQRYKGEFMVEVYPGTSTDFIKDYPVVIQGTQIKVKKGEAVQGMGAIQCYAKDKPFYFGYAHLKRITAKNGEILWQNWNEDKK